MRFFLVVAVLGVVASLQAAAPDLSRPHTFLGYSDDAGRLIIWQDQEKLSLGDGNALPLRLCFRGQPEGNRVFGSHWLFPLVESTLVRVSETDLLLNSISGRAIYLRRKKGEDGVYTSLDDLYVARSTSGSEMVVEVAGWKIRYVGGKIKELTTDKGAQFQWIWEASRFLAIRNAAGGDLLKFDYSGSSVQAVSLSTATGRYVLEWQQIPRVLPGGPGALISGYDWNVASITILPAEGKSPTSSAFAQALRIQQDYRVILETDGSYVMKFASTRDDPKEFRWDAATGSLKEAGDWSYSIEGKEGISTVKRTNPSGRFETYSADSVRGLTEYRKTDGTIVSRRYFVSRGPLFGKIRDLKETLNGTDVKVVRWTYDELGRLIRRRDGQGEYFCQYDPSGSVVKGCKVGDAVKWQEKYAADGGLVERTEGPWTLNYETQDGKTLIKRTLAGKDFGIVVMDKTMKQSVFLEPNESGELQLAPAFPSFSASPADVASAMAAARKKLLPKPNEKPN